MKLSEGDLFTLSQCALSAAYQAGHIIAQYIGKSLSVEKKDGGESEASQVFTEVDLLSQQCILGVLEQTCNAYDLALLTEEAVDDMSRLEKDYFWCIDPLDGTLPFIEGTPGYSVSIALVARDGTPLIGVVYDPVTATTYHAVKGCGAYRNGEQWLRDTISSGDKSMLFVCDRSFMKHEDYDDTVIFLNEVAEESGCKSFEVISHGGAAMNACWVMENDFACYFKYPKQSAGGGSLWDYAATTCIATELGCVASDIYGNRLDLNREDSTFMNHKGAMFATDSSLADKISGFYIGLN